MDENYLKVEQLARDIEALLGIKLIKQFDEEMSDPSNYDKDDQTKAIYYTVVDEKFKINEHMNYTVGLSISVEECFQFYHDATPYPTSLNSEEDARIMSQALIECPKLIKDLTPEIYQSFMTKFNQNFLESE
jgi:hypothetical protein